MDFTRTRGSDWLAAIGGLLVLVALFLPWYETRGVGVSGWEAMTVIDVVLALGALVALALPFVTAARDSTPVPLVVNVAALTAALPMLVLLVVRVLWTPDLAVDDVEGVISGAGDRLSGVDRAWGLWVGLFAVLLTLYGSYRALRDDRAPGIAPAPEPARMSRPPARAAS